MYVELRVLMAAILKIAVFWKVMSCSLADCNFLEKTAVFIFRIEEGFLMKGPRTTALRLLVQP
jgi:hypothetical protein